MPLEGWMLDAPPSFWVDVFHRLGAANGATFEIPRPSNKALKNLQGWLKRKTPKGLPSSCELNAKFRARLLFDRGGGGARLQVDYL